jgi:hypothetical protein
MNAITVNGPDVDLSSVVNAAREGDRLYIEVKEVRRMNFRGEQEEVNVSRQFNVPLI